MSFSIGSSFTYPFSYTPHPLVREEAERLIAEISGSQPLDALFSEGKMLGVLMVDVAGCEEASRLVSEGMLHVHDGCVGFLHGFSGLAGGRSQVPGFVPPIFDLAAPDGHFRQEEARISELSSGIAHESDPSVAARLSARRRSMSEELQRWIFRQFRVLNARGECRDLVEVFAPRGIMPPGGTGECALPRMLQFAYQHGLRPLAFGEFWYGRPPRGELRRHGCFYPSCMGKCGPLLEFMLQGIRVEPNPMEAYSDYTFRDISVLYEDDDIIVVDKPAGLLSVPGRIRAASLLVWLQRRERDRSARRGMPDVLHAAPCSSCQGGDASQFSVPDAVCASADGKADTHAATIYSCHRLDMDTSGVMVFARNARAQAQIQRQFENREVSKTYLALLSGPGEAQAISSPDGCQGAASECDRSSAFMSPDRHRGLAVGMRGTISLPMTPDYYDRPRQMVDVENGKAAVSGYEVLEERDCGVLLVRFTPKTGRTHQLRVHAAHPDGLGRPILGDRLYGGCAAASAFVSPASPSASVSSSASVASAVASPPSLPEASDETLGSYAASVMPRLCLHAESLTFSHPVTGRLMAFTSVPDFL